jgi:hypothetical protein
MAATPLSPEALAQVPAFVQKWTAIGLSTAPVDREWAERALAWFYAAAGLGEPIIIWAPCPLSAIMSAVVYATIRSPRHVPPSLDPLIDRVAQEAFLGLVTSSEQPIRNAVRGLVGEALRLHARSERAGQPLPYPTGRASSAALNAANRWHLDS